MRTDTANATSTLMGGPVSSMPATPPARDTVKPALTARRRGKRPRRFKETPEYAANVRALLRALGRRVGAGHVDDLPEIVKTIAEAEAVLAAAVTELHTRAVEPYSWAEIAARLGITRQAAQMRFGKGGQS
jgi:hypothetical protein